MKGAGTMDAITALSNALANINKIQAWQVLGLLTAAGAITMAFMQVIKEVTPVRRAFQEWWMTGWIKERAAIASAKPDVPIDSTSAKSTLVELATGGNARAFFELPSEQMIAQVNAAAQIVIEYPKASPQFEQLLRLLSAGAIGADVEAVLAGPPTPPNQAFLDARNRVSHRIQRNLDGAQIALGSRWKFWMQIVAIVISIFIFEIAVLGLVGQAGFSFGAFLLAIPIGIVGGYIAPVTRDLVAVVEKFRK
jgi:hypothetical protein